jgi:multidrug efflux pump subunit AcrB
MGRITDWFIENPIAANLMMVLIITMGLVTFPVLSKQFFPERELNKVTISVVYPGASPAEIEQQICIRIEEAVHDLDGVDELQSTASEGTGVVTIEVDDDYDPLRLLNEVKSRVDGITTFPEQAERPQIVEHLWRSWFMSVVVAADIGEANLKELGEQLRTELAALPEIQLVELTEVRDYELSIEVSELELRRYGLRFEDVVAAIRGSSLNQPAGKLRTRNGDIQIQTRGQGYNAADFARIVLLSDLDGTRVLLGDVASINDGFAETDLSTAFNGKPFVSLHVIGTSNPDILKASKAVYLFVDEVREWLPEGIEVSVWRDQSVSFRGRLNTLLKNGAGGLVLVFIVLLLFLRPLLAFWVCVGISVAFLGAIWLLPLSGASLNVISLFAFILILGIVVDDAIIVAESIYTYQTRGLPGPVAAARGVRAVLKPVWFAVITTMLFFGSFFLLPDKAPEAQQIARVVVLALAFSLLECLFILPAHLAKMRPQKVGGWSLNPALERFSSAFYQPLLRWAMAHNVLTVLGFVMALFVVLSFYIGGWMVSSFFPVVTSDYLITTVQLHEGGTMASAMDIKQRVDAAAQRLKREVNEETGRETIVHHMSIATPERVVVSVGLSREEPAGSHRPGFRAGVQACAKSDGLHYCLLDEWRRLWRQSHGHRAVSNEEMKRRWQAYIGELPDVKDMDLLNTVGHAGKDISLLLTAPDVETLRAAATQVKQELLRYPGVYNVRDSLENPSTEIVLTLKPRAQTLGITLAQLGEQVRRGFYGAEVQRIPRLREDVKVMVRYPREEREAIDFLQGMRIRAPGGLEIPFEAVAEIEYVPGYQIIQRIDQHRVSVVSAELKSGFSAPAILGQVMSQRLPEWQARYPGFDVSLYGRQQDREEFMSQMLRLMLGTCLVVYGMMAIAFRSLWQPVLILVAVPFGYMGAIIGHLLFGKEMSMFSVLGIIACAGVVINDNLVLIDRVNQLRGRGAALVDALLQGGRDRFRPILLTSVTTFVGLLPITLERSVQAQFLIPMVISLTFGVLLSTVVTLVFVPCLYLLLDSVVRLCSRGYRLLIKPA